MVSDGTAVAKLVPELAKQSGRSAKGWASPCPHVVVVAWFLTMKEKQGLPGYSTEFNLTQEKDP